MRSRQSLNDFKSSSCLTVTAYGYLWVSLFISCAVYGVDTFTAVNLLAFDKFTGITPTIPLTISKWIISGCVIASWVNLAYEHFRAWRVIRRGAVAESFLDSLAVRLQAIRITKAGRGWRRFLVFSELASSKKGAEYVALFTYFAFQSWIRVIFCSGPRQVVNALTLYSVLKANVDTDETNVGTSIVTFFKNIGLLAEKNHQQAVILSGMLFTLVIWVFAALSLILAFLFYILFLWHYIPNSDGGLSGYCERKVNKKLTKIVSAKVNKALEDEERKKIKAARKAAGKLGKDEKPPMGRQATLPTLFQSGDKTTDMPTLGRADTMTTLPLYTSRPGTPSSQQPTLPAMELDNLNQGRPYAPSRLNTSASISSLTSNAPLMGAASEMGYGGRASPAPSLPVMENANGYPFPPQRSMTGQSNNSSQSAGTPYSRGPTPLSRQQTQDSYSSYGIAPVRPQDMFGDPAPPFAGQASRTRYDAYGRPIQTSTSSTRTRPDPYGLPDLPSPIAAPNFASEAPGSSVLYRSATPTIPFLGTELSGSTPSPPPATALPTIPSFAAEMPVPGSSPATRFAQLSSDGRSSPSPSQVSAMNHNTGRSTPISRPQFTASPAPMSPESSYASSATSQPAGYIAYQPGARSASAGINGRNYSNGSGHTQNAANPYRNMTDPGMMGPPPSRTATPQGRPPVGRQMPQQQGSQGPYQGYDGSTSRGGGPGAPGQYRR